MCDTEPEIHELTITAQDLRDLEEHAGAREVLQTAAHLAATDDTFDCGGWVLGYEPRHLGCRCGWWDDRWAGRKDMLSTLAGHMAAPVASRLARTHLPGAVTAVPEDRPEEGPHRLSLSMLWHDDTFLTGGVPAQLRLGRNDDIEQIALTDKAIRLLQDCLVSHYTVTGAPVVWWITEQQPEQFLISHEQALTGWGPIRRDGQGLYDLSEVPLPWIQLDRTDRVRLPW